MTQTLSFDHAVLVVSDLDAAVNDYAALGFTVQPGGEHAGGYSHNALIGLADGGYLELFATVRSRHTELLRVLGAAPGVNGVELLAQDFGPVQARFMHSVAAGDGFADFALVSTALETDMERLRAGGIETEGPLDGARERPDGQRLAWRFGLPHAPALPFLIDDVTDRALRAPTATPDAHANGASGVAGVVIAVADLGASAARFSKLLGTGPSIRTSNADDAKQLRKVFDTWGMGGQIPGQEPNEGGTRSCQFILKNRFSITLVQPPEDDGDLARHLATYGQRPYLLRLYTNKREYAGMLDPDQAHGTRIELVSQPDN